MTQEPGNRFERAAARFEAAHGEDPRRHGQEGAAWSSFYHRSLARWVDRLVPDAPEPMRLAARCQHIRRWTVPRSRFPAGVRGYKQWRSTLARFHAEQAATILAESGYDKLAIARVRNFLTKKGLRRNPEIQAFEDAICLTFLELELPDFASKHERANVADILRKTWAKMSPLGRRFATGLLDELQADLRDVVRAAVAPALDNDQQKANPS